MVSIIEFDTRHDRSHILPATVIPTGNPGKRVITFEKNSCQISRWKLVIVQLLLVFVTFYFIYNLEIVIVTPESVAEDAIQQ